MFGLMEQKRGKFLAFHLGAAGLKKKKKWENDNDYWDTWDKRQARGATKPAACEIGRAAWGFVLRQKSYNAGQMPCVIGFRL